MARSDPQTNLKIPEELKQQLKALADEEGRSFNSQVLLMLKMSLAKYQKSGLLP